MLLWSIKSQYNPVQEFRKMYQKSLEDNKMDQAEYKKNFWYAWSV